MPFKSDAQRAYLAIHHPEIAHRWAQKYGPSHNLPQHVAKPTVNNAVREGLKARHGR